MAQKLVLKEKSGNFELWARGESSAYVMVASGEVGQPHRVSVELMSASGLNATRTARNLFDNLVMTYRPFSNSNHQPHALGGLNGRFGSIAAYYH